jgi:hypothetical protein
MPNSAITTAINSSYLRRSARSIVDDAFPSAGTIGGIEDVKEADSGGNDSGGIGSFMRHHSLKKRHNRFQSLYPKANSRAARNIRQTVNNCGFVALRGAIWRLDDAVWAGLSWTVNDRSIWSVLRYAHRI